MLLDRAAAVALRDGVRGRPACRPTSALPSGPARNRSRARFHAFARIYARAHVAVDALEPAARAKRVELVRVLHELERAQAVVIRGVERRQRVVVAMQQREIARALEVDHGFRRVRRARLLERGERVVVALQLALRLRDAQQAQAIVGALGQDLAILNDGVLPAALLETRGRRGRRSHCPLRPLGREPARRRRAHARQQRNRNP